MDEAEQFVRGRLSTYVSEHGWDDGFVELVRAYGREQYRLGLEKMRERAATLAMNEYAGDIPTEREADWCCDMSRAIAALPLEEGTP